MRHLSRADFRAMPWANGRGETLELWRETAPDGSLSLRLSVATVAEDGPFSRLPGIERVLTVIEGPGFRLTGDAELAVRPLEPVAFSGDLGLSAAGVAAPSRDFNVMTARALPRPVVQVVPGGAVPVPPGGRVFLLALSALNVAGQGVSAGDLLVLDAPVAIAGPAVAVTTAF